MKADAELLLRPVHQFTCGLPRIREKRGKKCVVYSFGVERESSWEAEILERTDCELYMYDFSVETVSRSLKSIVDRRGLTLTAVFA